MPNHNVDQQATVDEYLALPKSMAGRGKWAPTDFEGQWRWVKSLEIDGEGTGINFMVDVWPSSIIPRFTLTLNYGPCISRVDASPNERHNNHKVKGKHFPYEIEAGWIFGPHFHTWRLNRHLASPFMLPKELEFAIPLPERIQGFENVFRCFCGENNIECPNGGVPLLPDKDHLL